MTEKMLEFIRYRVAGAMSGKLLTGNGGVSYCCSDWQIELRFPPSNRMPGKTKFPKNYLAAMSSYFIHAGENSRSVGSLETNKRRTVCIDCAAHVISCVDGCGVLGEVRALYTLCSMK